VTTAAAVQIAVAMVLPTSAISPPVMQPSENSRADGRTSRKAAPMKSRRLQAIVSIVTRQAPSGPVRYRLVRDEFVVFAKIARLEQTAHLAELARHPQHGGVH